MLMAVALLPACNRTEKDEIDGLREGFRSPPLEARPRALWDWVDGNFQLEEITREMEEARRMGLGGFDIWDVRSVMDEAGVVPAGPPFMGDESVEAICHAINEAERIGLDLGLIISSGWNAGGSWTLPEHQTMGLFDSRFKVSGPGKQKIVLPFPELPLTTEEDDENKVFITLGEDGLPVFYKDVAVLAWPSVKGENECIEGKVLDLSERMDASGVLNWDVPEGEWTVVRYVCTNTGQPMFSSTPNSHGPMIDHFNAEASERHIRYFIEKLEKALGKSLGESGLSYFYTDSYEVKGRLWTPQMPDEFQERMGYSLLPYLPVLDGETVESPEISRRFMYDFRRVLSDLIIENHYRRTREICEEHGVGFVAEAAGPGMPIHNCPFESLLSSGSLSFPRGEFWHLPQNSDYWRAYRGTEDERHFLTDLNVIKGVACASHIYNQKYVEAEAFTGIHLWNEGPGDLKPTVDRAFCEGLNRINFHTWPHTPEEAGTPGWAYAFGTLINENRIWWPMGKPFIEYLGRCSYMLQQGQFIGDVLFYYGDSAPNFVPPKHIVEGLGFGFDYDVCNSDILLNKLEVKDGRLVLPHGQNYALLVLPDEDHIQAGILEKIGKLTEAGATIVGPKPLRSHGLYKREQHDIRVRELAEKIWGDCDGIHVRRQDYGLGEIICGEDLRSILREKGIGPDFDFRGSTEKDALDFIHRSRGDTEIYFIRNAIDRPVSGKAVFRQKGGRAEYWDPASGLMYRAESREVASGLELDLNLDAHGSVFVVFYADDENEACLEQGHPPAWFREDKMLATREIKGPWQICFPEESGGIGEVVFDSLVYWNRRPEDGIRFFSGIATYEKAFDWTGETKPDQRIFLELSSVVEVARVYLNGEDLGVLWKKPFRADITAQLQTGKNLLRVDVANTWANGLVGDARLPAQERRTRTNVSRLPIAWAYPLETIPREEYGLIPAGLSGTAKISTFTTR